MNCLFRPRLIPLSLWWKYEATGHVRKLERCGEKKNVYRPALPAFRKWNKFWRMNTTKQIIYRSNQRNHVALLQRPTRRPLDIGKIIRWPVACTELCQKKTTMVPFHSLRRLRDKKALLVIYEIKYTDQPFKTMTLNLAKGNRQKRQLISTGRVTATRWTFERHGTKHIFCYSSVSDWMRNSLDDEVNLFSRTEQIHFLLKIPIQNDRFGTMSNWIN